MNRIIQEKITRFIELSKKFSKQEDEVFTADELKPVSFNGCITANGCITTSGTMSFITTTSDSKVVTPTRSEIIIDQAASRAALSDDFDEFLYLQQELENYFEELNNITER